VRTLTTGELAKELGVSRGAILKWQKAGWITPEFVTPGKHARWNVENVREQLQKLHETGD
jgi:excisionase family DNA binding protein